MYHSKASKFNIVDATPFNRDPMKELAAAAQKAGIKLCFYYSQTQDWHEPTPSATTGIAGRKQEELRQISRRKGQTAGATRS